MADEERCVLVVTQSLEQLSSRLHARPNAHPSEDESSEGVVSVAEGAQFVGLLDSVVHAKHDSGHQRTRELILNLQPSLVPTLCSILQSESILRTVEEPNSSALLNQISNFFLHCGQVRNDEVGKEGTAVAIAQDLCQAITQANGVDALLRVSLQAPQEEVYAAASQALYSILHVSPHARQRMTDEALFKVLVRSLGDDAVPRRRHVLALCLREVVNDQPFTVSSFNEAILVLVRAFSLDENPDVQIAAAESLEMLLKADSDQWRTFGRKRELAMGIIGIIEKGTSTANNIELVQISAIRLLEICIRCEGCVPTTEAHFIVTFLKSFGDRHLARLHTAPGKVGALAARSLRLIVQNAPPASGLGIALMNDQNALGCILEGLLTASSAPLPEDENDAGQQTAAIIAKFLCVEASFCIALILAQDPQSRDAFAHNLSQDYSSMGQVRAAIVKGLNAAALEYYNDAPIVDVTGVVLNDPVEVDWESGGSQEGSSSNNKRPTQASIRGAFDEQEERLVELIQMAENDNNSSSHSEVPLQIVGTAMQNLKKFKQAQSQQTEQTAQLTFIMLTYAALTTLKRDDENPDVNGGFVSNQHMSSPTRGVGGGRAPAGVVQGILNSSAHGGGGSSSGQNLSDANNFNGGFSGVNPEHPAPTRASLLRTWANNPRQREALEKAASAAASGDHSLVVTSPRSSTYVDVMMKRDSRVGTPPRLGGSPSRNHNQNASNHHQALHHSSAISLGISQAPIKQYAFSKFDSALALATAFAQFYSKSGPESSSSPSSSSPSRGGGATFETDGQFARRKAPPSSAKKKAHYAAPTPNAKTWGIPQLKEGDLFYFSIPLSNISVNTLEQVQNRAVRHLKSIKDQFSVTPHAARARRWFLFDMLNNIMPGIISCFAELVALCDAHGEESVKFPLLLFAESVGARQQQQTGSSGSPGAIMERGTLHSGNLIESTAQARFYFQSVTQQQQQQQARTQASPMGVALSAGEEASSAYLKDLERKISALAEQRFSGHERVFPSISDDEDEDTQFADGGGGINANNTKGNSVVTPGSRLSRNNMLGKKDVISRAKPNRRRGMHRGIDRIGDDDESD